MYEALFYEKIGDSKIHCSLCPRSCTIATGKYGFCGVRRNIDGKLYSMIYGKISSACADPIEKKPFFHFHPGSLVYSIGSLGCNMRCGDCQNWQIAHASIEEGVGRTAYVSPEELVLFTEKSDCKGIAWTYNEPSIWMEYAIDGARLAKEKGFYTVFVTNGYVELLALDAIGPYLDAYRVDIKGRLEGESRFYREVARLKDPGPILKAAARAKSKWDMHLEIVTNVVPGYNDSPQELRDIAKTVVNNLGKETPWHVTRFYPYLELSNVPPTPVKKLEEARDIGISEGLEYVYVGNVPGHPGENTYCLGCKKPLIERMGFYATIVGIDKGRCKHCGRQTPIVENHVRKF